MKEDRRKRRRCQVVFYGLNRKTVDRRTRELTGSHVAIEKGIPAGKVGKKS